MLTTRILLKVNIRSLQMELAYKLASGKNFPCKRNPIQGVRTLYSNSHLGIDRFILSCSKMRDEYKYKDTFLNNLDKFSSTEKIPFFSDDLSLLIAFCQNDKRLLQDVIKLSKTYYLQVKGLNLRPFKIGPIIMRLLHYYNCPDEASQMLLDEELGNLFNQISSYHIAMDLLYENQRYYDVRIIMDKLLKENLFTVPTSCLNLALASNYKIGTEEAMENSLLIIQQASKTKGRIPIRTLGFAAGLALKLHKPQQASEILIQAESTSHFIIDNINVLSKAQLGFIDDTLEILKTRVLTDIPKTSSRVGKLFYCSDVIDEIEKKVNDTLKMDLIEDIKYLKNVLITMKLLSPQTLDECICMPIEERRPDYYESGNTLSKSSKEYYSEMSSNVT